MKKITSFIVFFALLVNMCLTMPMASAEELPRYDYSSFIGVWYSDIPACRTLDISYVDGNTMTFELALLEGTFTKQIENNEIHWSENYENREYHHYLTFYDDKIHYVLDTPDHVFECWFTSETVKPRRITDGDYSAELNGNKTEFDHVREYPQRFWDVPKDHWAFTYIAELVDKGVLAGYEDGSFRPDNTVTRAEWAKIMVLASGLPANDNNVYYTDMSNHWANIYVNTAKDYLAAYTDGTFKPDQAAVREDVTVSMVKLKGYDISQVDYSYLSQFTDIDSISNSLKAYVAVAVEKELIDGFEDGTFRGQDTLTRAEAATLLWRAFQYGNDNKVVDTPTSIPTPTPTQKPEEVKPIETPEPTGEPDTTPKPTDEPEVPDEPEASSEPELNQKPYKVDTLAKANVSEYGYLYTQDDNGIYYVEDGRIIKVDIKSKDKEEILNVKDLTIDTDEVTLDDFDIRSICYDKYQDRLLVQGEYKTVNPAREQNNSYLYEVKENNTEVITDNFPLSYSYPTTYLVGILSNGDYITTDTIIDYNNFNEKEDLSSVLAAEEVNNHLYYLYERTVDNSGSQIRKGYRLKEYDFVDSSTKWEFEDNSHGFVKISALGISNRNFAVMYDEMYDSYIKFYNFNGKQLNEITNNDYIVVDKSPLDFSNTFQRLLITDNDDIIFYDTSVNAFRMISKND